VKVETYFGGTVETFEGETKASENSIAKMMKVKKIKGEEKEINLGLGVGACR